MSNQYGSRWLPAWKRLAIYERDQWTCQYWRDALPGQPCQRDLRGANRREVTLDHVNCRVDGGDHEADNLITACIHCNSRRQDKSFRQFASRETQRIVRIQIRKPLNVAAAKQLLAQKKELAA